MRYLSFILLWLPLSVFSQTGKIDSILSAVRHAANENDRLERVLALCDEYKSISRDTLDKYAYLARDMADRIGNNNQQAGAALAMSYMYWRWGWIDSSLVAIDNGLQLVSASETKERELYFRLKRQKAMCLGGADRLQDALTVLYELVEEAENYSDTIALSANLNTLGSIALVREKPSEAVGWLSKAAGSISGHPRYGLVRSAIYLNFADAYKKLNKADSAQYYINEGLRLCYRIQNLDNLAIGLQRKADIMMYLGKLKEAEASLLEMLETRRKMGDPAMWVSDNLGLANFYIETGQTDKAITFCKGLLGEGKDLAINGPSGQVIASNIKIRLAYYEVLARCYKIKGEQKPYLEFLEKIVAAKDSFYEANSAEAIAGLQMRYDVQKKENTIIQQQYELLKKDYFLYGSLALLGLASAAGWLIFSEFRKRQQLKTALILQQEKDSAARAIAHAEESERRRIAADLHDNLGAYAASIVSNLEFIDKDPVNIESRNALRELRHNSMAIVSQLSDTIWILNKKSLSLTALSDRVKVFFHRLERSFPHITFAVNEAIGEDVVIPPFQAFHLYQIIREASINAARHSHCTSLTVQVEGSGGWRICINDNGTGMTAGAGTTGYGGNGIANMKARAAEAGWTIRWHSKAGEGTSVELTTTSN
ncbi:MAG: hypothetical protein ABS46_05675 [Cytophagaceae bacterium SCN 52-12]|nr:MAG: hypothetical protein ABS46_05675 [Cytophagaceae bacterium SCN 52-12]